MAKVVALEPDCPSLDSGSPCPSSVILVNYVSFLCRSFLISKIGIMICHRVVEKIRKVNAKCIRSVSTNIAFQRRPGTG